MYSSDKKPPPVKAGKVAGYATRPPRQGDQHRWYWQIIGPGKKTLWTGWATRNEAESRAAAALLALPSEETLPSAPALPPRKATIADVLAAWIEDVCSRHYTKTTTRRGAKQAAEQINRLMGGMDIEAVTVVTTGKYISRRMAEGVKDRTAYGELCYLRTAWRWGHKARNHGAGESFPMPPLKMSSVVRRQPETREDAWAVLDALGGVNAPEWAIRAYTIALLTGARTGEIYSCKVKDFHPDEGVLHFPEGKTGAGDFALDDDGIAMLKDMTAGTEPEDRIVGDVAWTTLQTKAGTWFKKACEHVGVEPFTIYGLRYSADQTQYAAGCDVLAAGRQMRHTPATAQRHYLAANGLKGQRKAARLAKLGARPDVDEGAGKVIPLRKSS